ncbi:MAG TPA: sugar phosphate isomerase/epimerase family protein [Pyrinomonadaceae bacterium]|nr:sugar phosphate isomerase/epimerase family protein [Pyrinomonadaceae bacterium]
MSGHRDESFVLVMKLAFSTLGCPHWELEQVAQAARAYGYQAVELRAIGGDLDLLRRPEFQPGAIEATRHWLADRSLTICCVDTSCAFDSRDAGERDKQIQVALRHAELATALGASLIRIFPDKIQPGATHTETRDNIAACLRAVAQDAPDGVRIGLETHGDFARGQAAGEIMRIADHPQVVLIWDVANSLAAGDSIAEAAGEVAPYLAHVHLRDARAVEGQEHWLPVLAGRGAVSFDDAAKALRGLNYEGYVSFEWEKYWHPEIEEPEVALPDFVKAMKAAMMGFFDA